MEQKEARSQSPESPAKVQRVAELHRRRAARTRRRALLLGLALAFAVFVMTGLVQSTVSALGDAVDTVQIFFDRSGGFPAQTGVAEPLRILPLKGGYVILGSSDVVVGSAQGSIVSRVQPSYARPALTAGDTRYCVYNRAGTEFSVHSRLRPLYAQTTEQNIFLCSMSPGGALAVVTDSNRYTSEVTVYDRAMDKIFAWYTTESEGTPILVRFSADDRRFAVGCLSAVGGQLVSRLYFLNTGADTVTASYSRTGSSLLRAEWLTGSRVLAVYNDAAVIVDPSSGEELASLSFSGETMAGLSVEGKKAALLLAARTGSRVLVLNEKLQASLDKELGLAVQGLSLTGGRIYLLREGSIECLSADGEERWRQDVPAKPYGVLGAGRPLAFLGGAVQPLEDPEPSAAPEQEGGGDSAVPQEAGAPASPPAETEAPAPSSPASAAPAPEA